MFVIAGNNGFVSEYDDGGYDRSGGDFRGRGRGRGRSFRGRGRGGYNGPQADVQQDGAYNEEAPPQGGRGMCFTDFTQSNRFYWLFCSASWMFTHLLLNTMCWNCCTGRGRGRGGYRGRGRGGYRSNGPIQAAA